MGKLTICLSDGAEKRLRKIAKENMRSMSKQLEYYIVKDKSYESSA